jgi:hypothetical protein
MVSFSPRRLWRESHSGTFGKLSRRRRTVVSAHQFTKQPRLAALAVLASALAGLHGFVDDGHLLRAAARQRVHGPGFDQAFDDPPVHRIQIDALAKIVERLITAARWRASTMVCTALEPTFFTAPRPKRMAPLSGVKFSPTR